MAHKRKKNRQHKKNIRSQDFKSRKMKTDELSLREAKAPAKAETLLGRARIHWLFGEWQRLCGLDSEHIAKDSERATVALLISSAQQQLDNQDAARQWARKAIQWGCSPSDVARLLAAGVHNTLGRMAMLKEDDNGVSRHFTASMQLASLNDTDTGTLARARASQEAKALNLRLPLSDPGEEKLVIPWDTTRPPGRRDIINAYRWVLGRNPESENIIEGNARVPTLSALRKSLVCSKELFVEFSKKCYGEEAPQPETYSVPRTAFMHLPKTGGTTIHAMLKEHFSEEQICPERWNNLYKHTLGTISRYRLFSGHFDYYSCCMIPGGDTKIITILREPKARLLSLYYFERAHTTEIIDEECLTLAELANKYNVLDFFQHHQVRNHNSIRNAMTNALIGCIQQGRWERSEPTGMAVCEKTFPSDETKLELAKKNLESMDAFGILELFDQSLEYIFGVLGLDTPEDYRRKNVLDDVVKSNPYLKPVEKSPVSEELDQTLDELTSLDRQLYEFACDLFKKRVSSDSEH